MKISIWKEKGSDPEIIIVATGHSKSENDLTSEFISRLGKKQLFIESDSQRKYFKSSHC